MASRRYTAEELLHLRQSTLCVKPPNLPPVGEWMGLAVENTRNQAKSNTNTGDRARTGENPLSSQENRRPPLDRNGSRNPANPDDIILGPPRTSFASSTSMRNTRTGEPERGPRDSDRQDRMDRFGDFRNRASDSDRNSNDRFRDGRDGKNSAFRRRNDQDQDSEGWSTVKPRKSFGHEGAERFQSRIGGSGGGDRFSNNDRRARDRDDRESDGRRNRNSDIKDDNDNLDGLRRNGLARGRSDPWFKESKDDAPMTPRERIDRAKSWREREPEDNKHDKNGDRHGDRFGDRNYERRWDREREQRVERDPEWLDEPAEEKTTGHTVEDFQKFMESMKKGKGGPPKQEEKPEVTPEHVARESVFDSEPKVASAPAVEPGPDRFFSAFGGGLDKGTSGLESKDAAKSKAGKASRFMALMAPQEDKTVKPEPFVQTAPSTPAAVAPPNGMNAPPPGTQPNAERAAFDLLIEKLHRSSGIGQPQQVSTPPVTAPMAAPTLPQHMAMFPEHSRVPEPRHKSVGVTSPEPFQQYMGERREDPRARASHYSAHDILSPRPMPPPVQPPAVTRPEQTLQELLSRPPLTASQASGRMEHNASSAAANQEFLMSLMQGARNPQPEQARPELLLRMPQPTKQINVPNLPHMPDLDQDFQRERSVSQRQMRSQGPPGFHGEHMYAPEPESRPQPTQILQRPPNLGVDHHMHPFPMGANPQIAPQPQQRPMIPPPGFVNGPRNSHIPQSMFPPNFPQGFPPPDSLVGPPRGSIPPPPPPGIYGGPPPPGFMPPPGIGGFQGPDGPGFPGPLPFERRGMLPPGPGGYRGP